MAKVATASYGVIPTTYPFPQAPAELARFPQADAEILRKLAQRSREIAGSAANAERKESWYRHNGLRPVRPMVLAEIQGCLPELAQAGHFSLRCANPFARAVEGALRKEQYEHEVLRDDHVVEPWLNLSWIARTTGHVDASEVHVHVADTDGSLSARTWDAPIKDIGRDFAKLRKRTYSVDREGTAALRDALERAVGDILPVRVRGSFWWTLGMTWTAIDLVGLESLMLLMYDDPQGLHRLMQFLCDDFTAYGEWLEQEGLLSLNNENDYIGSGSMGYTRELPRDGRPGTGGAPARRSDLWALLESQETVGVGPEQFEEFIFPYQKKIAEQYGLCYYGCCEPVNSRWHILKRIPNLRSVSVSPWADEELMARELAGRYVYSRKPKPTMVSTADFDEALIRADIRRTLDVARGCSVEIIMKDVHTLAGKPERLGRWVAIVREEIDRAA